jgi:hypothetical protein
MFYKTDPDIVEYQWTHRDFLDRQEYMYASNEYSARYEKWLEAQRAGK